MTRRALGIVAAVLGLAAAFAGDPHLLRRGQVDVQRLAAAVAHEEDHITAIQLGEWIRGRKQGLRVVDLREENEFDIYHIPTSERIPLQSLPSAQFRRDDTIVLISGGGAHAAQGWVFLRALGYERVFFLRGGVDEWNSDVMNATLQEPATPAARRAFDHVAALSRYFGGIPRTQSGTPAGRVDDHVSSAGKSTNPSPAATRRRGC